MEPCKKKSYPTKKAAKEMLETIKSSDSYSKKEKKELRAYQCKECGMFHLTSMTHKEYIPPETIKKLKTESRISSAAQYWENKLGLNKKYEF